MPGITGFIAPPTAENRSRLEAMLSTMRHESFYSSGLLVDEEIGIHLGWTTHSGSYSDCLPVFNEDHTIGLIVSGQHFAERSELNCLQSAGHQFNRSNATALVHLYEEKGSSFLKDINGNLSGFLWDKRQQVQIAFNDRHGLNRLYWLEYHGTPYFSSEAKSLLKILPDLRNLDLQSIGEYLLCGCTLRNRSLFSGINALPPATVITRASDGSLQRTTYHNPDAPQGRSKLEPKAYYSALAAAFNDILPKYLQSSQRVALSITGGLDSRMIIAGARASSHYLPTYTFSGTYRKSEDVIGGSTVAAICGCTHAEIQVGMQFFPSFLELASRCIYITDGCMDVSGSVGLYVNRLARSFGEIRITGNYGSEILRQNVAFKIGSLDPAPFSQDIQPYLKNAACVYNEERSAQDRLTFIAFKQVPWHHYSRYAEENSQLEIRSPYLDNRLVELSYSAPDGLLLNKQLAYQYTTDTYPPLAGAPTDRGSLKKPLFIPTKLFEIAKELRPKAEYYFDYGMPHWLVRADQFLSPLKIESLFLGNQKYYHFRTWYRHELARQLKEVLLDPTTLSRSIFNPVQLERMVIEHTSGKANHTITLHKLLSIALIYTTLLEIT